jgi:germination protein M
MKRILVLLGTLALAATACADGGPRTLGPVGEALSPTTGTSSTPPVPAPSPGGTPSPEPTDDVMRYEVWFVFGEGPWLFVTERTEPRDPAVGTAALRALFAGPTDAEAAAGVASAVPPGTELLSLSIEDGLATADLSSGFESGGGSTSMLLRLAQLTYTITQFPTVDAVTFTLDGEPLGDGFSGEGIVVDDPLTRRDFEDLLPAILVRTPVVGQGVTSPITVTGTANVFEATVSISVLDAGGREIARTFTTATCGTGCRGEYAEAVRYTVDHTQPGIVRVYESSAQDGQPINVVEVPVTLGA